MIYENVLSVAFIYAMGVYRGQKADPEEVIADSINYYQQTPNDSIIGDLLAQWNGKCFITEFKKNEKDLFDEVEKDTKALIWKELIKPNGNFVKLSEQGHFIAYGTYEEKETFAVADLVFKPYAAIIRSEKTECLKFNAFIEQIVSNKEFGWNHAQLKIYVDCLKKLSSGKKGSSGGRSQHVTEGVVTVISNDKKVFTVTYNSLEHLDQIMYQKITLSQYLQIQNSQGIDMVKKIQKDNSNTNNLSM